MERWQESGWGGIKQTSGGIRGRELGDQFSKPSGEGSKSGRRCGCQERWRRKKANSSMKGEKSGWSGAERGEVAVGGGFHHRFLKVEKC